MKISPDMRAMIDAAVAAGRVQVVPFGKTTAAVPETGSPKKSRGRLRKNAHTLDEKRARKNAKKLEQVKSIRDRRRFKTTPIATGQVSKTAPADAIGTSFLRMVRTPDGTEPVLKDGASNSKIGGDVLKGRLKGAHIVTLTLEERATCPQSCDLWQGCYGNNMRWATRWRVGPELESALRREVADLCATHGAVLVRMHVLGDFATWEYLCLWADLLDQHPGLHVFGFTAWTPETRIGAGVARLRGVYPDRFAIRHSGRTGPWGSFTIDFPTEKKRLGDAIVCPEQSEANNGKTGRHCGNCGLCWASDAPIVFIEH